MKKQAWMLLGEGFLKRLISLGICAILAKLLGCQTISSPALHPKQSPSPAVAATTLASPTWTPTISTATIVPTATNASLSDIQMFDQSVGWGILYVPREIAHTADGGKTWVASRIAFENYFLFDGQTAWLVSELGNQNAEDTEVIFHTQDGGRTWAKIPTPFRHHTALQFKTESLGWAVANVDVAAGNLYFELYQTIDGGQHWSQMNFSDPRGYPHERSLPAGTFHVADGEGFEFLDTSTFWFGGNQLVDRTTMSYFTSRNGGKSWVETQIPLLGGNRHVSGMVTYGLPVFVTDKDAYAVASFPVPDDQTGSYREVSLVAMTHDGGNTWSDRPSGVLAGPGWHLHLTFVSPSDAFVRCGDQLCTSRDGAKTWLPVASNLSFADTTSGDRLVELNFVSPTTGWAILNKNHAFILYRTTDGGKTWARLDARIAP